MDRNAEVTELKNLFRTTLAAALLALPSVASAAMSDWAESEGGRMRLVAISQPRNDAIMALLQIDPKPGWKTYWRNPGDAGMPPELDFGSSTNLILRSVSFPVPDIGKEDGGRFIGYHKPVSLVVAFEKPLPGAPSTVNLNAIVGICETICLPFMASFSVPLTPDAPEGEEFTQLQLALAELPEKPGKDFAIRNFKLSGDRKSVEAEITLPGDDEPEIAVAASSGLKLGKKEIKIGRDHVAHVRIPVTASAEALAKARLTMLVKSNGRAIEATLAPE